MTQTILLTTIQAFMLLIAIYFTVREVHNVTYFRRNPKSGRKRWVTQWGLAFLWTAVFVLSQINS